LTTFLLVDNGAARNKIVTGLGKYTVYEFQVLAYTSAGDGQKSSVQNGTTMEDGNRYCYNIDRTLDTPLLAEHPSFI